MKTLSSIIITVLLLQFFLPVFAQESHCVDLNKVDFEQFDLLNQDIEDKKIIMIGEEHYLAVNSVLQTNLLIHLNKKNGVRHLLIEFGRAEAYLYNQFLRTGDEWYLKHTFQGFSGYKEFFSNWKKLYGYNLDLDSDKKLVVHGLDLEREPGLSATIYELLSVYKKNPAVKRLMDSIKMRLDSIGIERNNKEYIYYLRKEIPALSLPNDENKIIIDNILSNNSFFTQLSERDKHMTQNFLELDSTDEAYLGQFGLVHTILDNENSMAGKLNQFNKYHNKILVMSTFNIESGTNNPFNLADCSVFLYRFDPSGGKFEKSYEEAMRKRMQWAIILKNPKRYSQLDE